MNDADMNISSLDKRLTAPVVISVYDRLSHLMRCVESLVVYNIAEKTVLHIFSDAPAREEHRSRIEEVRSYINTISGFKEVVPHFRPMNMGAHGSILSAFKEVFESSERLIFLEDDIIVSPHFLRYMNEGLEVYQDDPQMLAICAYRLPFKMPVWYRKDVFLGRRYSPWGVGLWREKFNAVDFAWRDRFKELQTDKILMEKSRAVGGDYIHLVEADSKKDIEAMDVRICHHQIVNNQFCLFPRISLSTNIGFDGSGMHCNTTERFDAALDTRVGYSLKLPKKIKESRLISERFRRFQDGNQGFVENCSRKIKKLLKIIVKKLIINKHDSNTGL